MIYYWITFLNQFFYYILIQEKQEEELVKQGNRSNV